MQVLIQKVSDFIRLVGGSPSASLRTPTACYFYRTPARAETMAGYFYGTPAKAENQSVNILVAIFHLFFFILGSSPG